MEKLIYAFISSRLDYFNAILSGVSKKGISYSKNKKPESTLLQS